MDFTPETSHKRRRSTHTCSPAPQRTRRNGAPNHSLEATIDRIKREPVGSDPKDAFTSNIWPSVRNGYDNMREELEKLCKNALQSMNIKSQVQSRTKATESIKASLDRREKVLPKHQKQFENFSEIFNAIHDLVGVRIILEYPDDIQKAIRFIEETFQKETDPVVFQFDREVGQHWKTWFGAYQTLNYRLRLKNDKSETLSQFRGVLFEIQLTTIAEHLYNKFAHPLLYKDSGGTLSRQDEMVIDMSHGISLCYSLCLMYMKEKLGKSSGKIKHKDDLVATTTLFHESLTKGASFDNFVKPKGPTTALDIPPGAYKSAADLREWIDGKINDILTEVRSTSQTIREAVLSKLPVAESAAFDSHAEEHNARCHPDTRTELLSQIQNWANNPQAESIFWLNGMAGTGKSTISRTVAESFADSGLLGASFFFKRGEGDRGKAALIFPTIASQLVCKIPTLAPRVRKAIDTDPAVPTKALRDQFEKLIRQPLSCIQYATAIVIVIDALDECDRANDVQTIISILAQENTQSSVRLRVFITSRPELPIRLGFEDVQGRYEGLVLHQIPEPIVKHDISVFLGHELVRIRDAYNTQVPKSLKLPLGWPGEDVVRSLAQMAVPLFIFAATACRFIADPAWSNPANQLKKILHYQARTSAYELDKLDATYLPILDQLTVGRTNLQKSRLLAEFRDAIGPIVLLTQPLSVPSLARLLNIPPTAIYGKLNSLHSVLDIPSEEDAPVRLFHLSFRDFLIDPTKRTTNDFWINEIKYHKTLADRCLQVMNQHLKRDICNLQMPGKLRSEVNQRTIDAALPPEVQYSCQYWVHHLKESKERVQDGGPVHSFLTSHLLHWLEALGLIGRISESIGIVDDLLALSVYAVEISGFLRDIRRVILSSRSIIDIAPLQVYASALVFSPTRSITRDLFKQEEPKWITSGPIVEGNWNACLQTLEGHGSSVNSVAFSPDSNLVVSGSDDNTVKIWDVATGACTKTLVGHSSYVNSVAFSPDSNLVVSGSDDSTVKIWDVATGACTKTLEGHSRAVMSSKWITRGLENWLWLPPGCRPGTSAVTASTIAIGCLSGRVLIITVATDNYN
ncbi:hypothetical protein B0H66DRAFT_483850 [Apodospora peruviana]|uniref:NACHT domain-containing protein n=1 Tax=Apodospora peruviana TaxID=516989 RepID=A0AAE0HVN4_9PEZI|nr:hypothetical protein B0H66DRAFT_483850 [Apodospora peruviana]